MPDRIETLRDRIRDLQRQMDEEWEARRAALRIHVERGRVRFEDEVRRRHRAARIRWRDFLAQTRPLVVLTAPVIYGLIVPLVLLDIAVNLYQLICFPVYGIPRVPLARLHRHRPPSPGLSERAAEAELRLLRLCQRADCLCARGRLANRGLLVPDQACPAAAGAHMSVMPISWITGTRIALSRNGPKAARDCGRSDLGARFSPNSRPSGRSFRRIGFTSRSEPLR
ncbi:hypothetical protein ACFOHS_11445 [Jhaorihella thermophila]